MVRHAYEVNSHGLGGSPNSALVSRRLNARVNGRVLANQMVRITGVSPARNRSVL